MPHSEIHKRKFGKNMAVLGLLFGFVALIFAISILRMSANTPDTPPASTTSESIENTLTPAADNVPAPHP